MSYEPDCLCGGECQMPCVAINQIREEIEREKEEGRDEEVRETIQEMNTSW